MTGERRANIILMAEDDDDDRLLIKEAFTEASIEAQLHFVKNGNELMDYLLRRGIYSELNPALKPAFILLDLNMPRKDGRAVLSDIKTDNQLRQIPVIVFTTSHDKEDISLSYNLGANSFIVKPSSFDELVRIFRNLGEYWLKTAILP